MVENLDDRLGIFGARFPYFERRFQFRIQFHKRTPGSSPFLVPHVIDCEFNS